MKIDKAIELLKNNGFWNYYESNNHFSNGKRQLTIINGVLYMNEHHLYKRGRMKNEKINSIKQLKEFIQISQKTI